MFFVFVKKIFYFELIYYRYLYFVPGGVNMLEELIKSECTDTKWDLWSDYRNRLTEHILSGIEHCEIKSWLEINNKLRPDKQFKLKRIMEEIQDKKGVKPTLAIWGAGGCNDIDIKRLSEYFRLVLIDRDVDALEQARLRANLKKDCCACVDIKFFDVTYSDYEMFEALLQDRCDIEEINSYLLELCDRQQPRTDVDMKFDYSVCVGLASQLTARLAAIAYRYNRLLEIEETLRYVSEKAVFSLFEELKRCTEKLIITGYEIFEIYPDKEDILTIDQKLTLYNEWLEEMQSENVLCEVFFKDEFSSRVVGNSELIKCIREFLDSDFKNRVFDYKIEIWPFTEEKHYVMGLAYIQV